MRFPIMVTKSQQTDFLQRFECALWRIETGEIEDNPDIYYLGQVELYWLCEQFVTAWNGGVKNGSK